MSEIENIIVEPKTVQDAFNDSTPFNLVRMAKNYDLKKEDLEIMGAEILDSVHAKLKPPTLCVLNGDKKSCEIIKVRIADETNEKGKSSGYRRIVLLDYQAGFGVLLGLYGKKDQSDLSQQQKNALKKLLKKYLESKGN